MKKKLILSLTAAALALPAGAVTVFQDTFTADNGTLLSDHTPEIGAWRSGTTGDISIQNNALDTFGSARQIFGDFTTTLSSGETLILTLTTAATVGNFFSSGWAGISLYEGETEQIFVGDPGGVSSSWGIHVPGGVGNADTNHFAAITTLTFTYEYDTGDWSFDSPDLSGSVTGTVSSEWKIDSLRVGNNLGGDFALDSIQVDVVPEPSIALLGGLGILGLLRRRR